LELEDRSQALYQAKMAAMQHLGSTEGRFRTFGGSSSPTQLAGSASFIRASDYSPTPTLQPSMGRRTHHLGPRVLDYKGRSYIFHFFSILPRSTGSGRDGTGDYGQPFRLPVQFAPAAEMGIPGHEEMDGPMKFVGSSSCATIPHACDCLCEHSSLPESWDRECFVPALKSLAT
jgi:hypothetical protein